MKQVDRLSRTAPWCPTCGAPMFPLMDYQDTPSEAVDIGIKREEIKICYLCTRFWILEPEKAQ